MLLCISEHFSNGVGHPRLLKKQVGSGWQRYAIQCWPVNTNYNRLKTAEPGGVLEHGHAAAALPGQSCCGTAPEASEAEYRAAVAEATQARALLVCQADNLYGVSCAVQKK